MVVVVVVVVVVVGAILAGGGMSFNETNAKHNTRSLNNSVLHCSAWAEISLQKMLRRKIIQD